MCLGIVDMLPSFRSYALRAQSHVQAAHRSDNAGRAMQRMAAICSHAP